MSIADTSEAIGQGIVASHDATGVAMPSAANFGYRSQTRPEMVAFLPVGRQHLKVLDVGCGEGAFGASIACASEVWGIEPFLPSADIAERHLFKVFRGTFEAVKTELPLHYFDVVVCNDVIEHMVDHDAFLTSIQEHMAPGASLIGSLPNVRYHRNLFHLLFVRDWQYEDSGILDRTHFRFFTMKSLRRSLEKAGFMVSALHGINGKVEFKMQRWSLAYSLFAYGLMVLTGGAARDVQYLQIGFRAVLPQTAGLRAPA